MGIDKDKFNKVTDPLNISKGRASKWADPLGILTKEKDTSAEDAARREAERQARIESTIGDINAMFDSAGRQNQISQYGTDLLDFFTTDLNKQQGIADRNLRFALARSGQTGGSLATDQNRQLGEDYQRGLIEANRRAQSGMADLRSADEQARLNLTSLAQQGLSTTNAAQQASAAMRAALDYSSANNRAQGLGDIFGGALAAKTASEEAAARRRADRQYTQQYTPYYSFGG